MPDHDRQALREFIEQLARLREEAGGPSLPALKRLSEQALPHGGKAVRVLAMSTTHEILSHKRKRWPEWEWVASFVSACLAFAEDAAGVDPRRLGDICEWRDRFLAARNRHRDPAGSTTPTTPTAPIAPDTRARGTEFAPADAWSLTRSPAQGVQSLAPVAHTPDAGHAARLAARPQRRPSPGARALGSVWPTGAVAERSRSGELPEPPTTVRRGGPRVVQMMLGTRLHRLREERCITHKDAAQAIRVSAAKIDQMERGRVTFKEAEVAGLLALYGVTDASERTALLSLVHQANTPGWWHTFSGILPDSFQTYLGLEEAASLIRSYAVQFVPELLQTSDYARAVLRLGYPDASPEEIERHVSLRMRRQQLLTRPGPLKLWAVVDEMALLRPTGGVEVMRAQLRRLIEATALPNVTLNLVSLHACGYAAVTGPFSILRFTEPELPDVIYLEQLTGAIYLDNREDLDRYALVMESLCTHAASPADSVRTLHTILKDL